MGRNKLSQILLGGLLLSILGCSFGIDFTPKEQTFYTIAERSGDSPSASEKFSFDLAIRETGATPFLSGRKIIFGETSQTRGFYQFASWVEPLPKRFSALLREAMRQRGAFRSVTRSSLSAHGDLELVTEMVECYHLISSSPGTVQIVIEADLLQSQTGVIVAHERFAKSLPSPTFDAAGSVSAIQLGLFQITDDIIAWTEKTAASLPPPSSHQFPPTPVAK